MQSTVWDLNNNVVTYSDNVTGMALESATRTVNLSQFNSVNVANAEGAGSSSEYTLTKVILSIDGSISGNVKFENESPSTANDVTVTLYDFANPAGNGQAWSQVSFNGNNASESYSYSRSFDEIAADSDADPDWAGDDYRNLTVNENGTGEALSGDITSDLQAYIGSGNISTEVDFQGQWSFDNLPNNQSIVDVYGDAAVSVSYYYDYTPVPEPTSAVFMSLGLIILALLKRPKQKNPSPFTDNSRY
ncbi:MAG: choice-of-anchor E domain-containing protein [Kiritimatiellia bacterium]